jgi:hypothetical protein
MSSRYFSNCVICRDSLCHIKRKRPSHASFGDAWQIIPGRADLYTALDITPDHLKLQLHDGEPVLLHDKILHYGSKYWPDYMAPAALLNGSIGDLVNWEKALAAGNLINASSLNEMIAPYKLPDGKSGDFGLAFFTKSIGPNVHRYAMASYGGGAATWRLAISVEAFDRDCTDRSARLRA